MLDSGSSRSFIGQRVAYHYFKNNIYREPFEVVSTHGVSIHTEVVLTPLPKIFKNPESHKFYVYDVDNNYDGLLGSNLLKQLDAKIDYQTLTLCTRNTDIPFVYPSALKDTYILPPRSELRVKLPVNLTNGEAILDFKELTKGVRMPCALVNCVNGYAYTVIQNCKDIEMILKVTSPFQVEPYNHREILVNQLNDTDRIELLSTNLKKIRLDHMNEEERTMIQKICEEYKDIFYCEDRPLSFTNEVKHKIRTVNEDPINIKAYRLPPTQTDEIRRQVDKMLKDDVIRESNSPWSAPVHLVPKKLDASGQQKWRMVVDYRRLNEITVDDKYPLPNINDLFDKLGKSMYFSTLDLASGYHQLQVQEEDRQKTAFTTPFGLYEFNRMPFGLKTAPATFQRAMDNVLRGLQGLHCLVYLDDVIIFSTS